jgi:hypothetical protein
MSEIRIENIPQTWDDTRDVAFFRIVALLFTTEFVYGAGVVLGSYDDLDKVAADSDVSDAPASTPNRLMPVTPRIAR